MILLRHLLWRAALLAARDRRLQQRAARIYERQVEPRAKAAWAAAKPKVEARLNSAAEGKLRRPAALAARIRRTLWGGRRSS